MAHNPSLTGAADAIERSKNAGSEFADQAQSKMSNVTERAKDAFDSTREAAQSVASEAYDQMSEAYRAGGYYARRYPLETIAATALLAFALGYLFRR
jgi:ElaB/YqjD/DUF883 family membrane-anchored ribosome-binding protein